MILHLLTQTAFNLEIAGVCPAFIYDGKGMDNYEMDKVPEWSINMRFIEDEIRFDLLHERKYNLPISFHIKSEINQSSEFYQAKFNLLAAQQRAFLIALDKFKDSEGRKILTVRGDIPIKTLYFDQTNNFDVPSTALYFNLPLLYNQYNQICK